MLQYRPGLAASAAIACLSGAAAAQTFEFNVLSESSGLYATMGFQTDTSGTLIGDWDPDANPGGTRTKPGLFGYFAPTDNEPVDVAIGVSLLGDLDTATSGAFRMTVDTGGMTVRMSGLSADLLAGGSPSIPATLRLAPDSFRTRAPDSVYVGIPLDLPIGELSVTSLLVNQSEDDAVGILTEIEPGRYAFSLVGAATLDLSVTFGGMPMEVAGSPIALAIQGEIVVAGNSATVTSVQTLDLDDEQFPGVELPELPLELPTILPPGETAHLLTHLTLDRFVTTMIGSVTLNASGEATTCRADFNGDGAVNTIDFIMFLNAWSARRDEGDFNGDGTINTVDVTAFLNEWVVGC